MSGRQRGIDRERALRDFLERHGWVVVRSAGSMGSIDLVALTNGVVTFHPWKKDGGKFHHEVLFIEVKSTTDGPYKTFGPDDRAALRDAAVRAGASPFLVWWPPRAKASWIPSCDWPSRNV